MIKVVYIIFTIIIKDLKVHLDNSNQVFGRNVIWFKCLAQKKKIYKQITSILYYKY